MRDKKTIILVFLSIAMNVIIIAGWFYLTSFISDGKNKVEVARRNLATVESSVKDNKSLKVLMENIQEKRAEIGEIFLGKESIIKFIEQLEEISDKTGASMKLNSVVIDKNGKNSPVFKFELSGSFREIFHYIKLLENVPYQIVFQRAYVQSDDEGWSGNFDIILASYIYEG